MDVRKSTRLRKKPTVTYHPQNSHRNKRLKRSSPNEEEEEEAVLLEEEDGNHQTQKRKPHSVEDKKPVVVSVSSRHHKIFHDLFGMMRYTKPYNQFLAYIQQNHVTNDDLQQILKLCDKKHGYNLIHQALSCYNISTNSTIDYNLVKLFLLQVKNNKNKKNSSSSSAEETASAATTNSAAAAKEALLVPTKDQRLTPLHIACCNIQKLVPKKIKILLDLDTTKSSLYHQSKNGVIPLHCLCSGIDVDGLKDTIQLLLQYDKTKKSLLIKNKLGQTPIDKVANEIGDVIIITNNNNNKKKNKNDTKLSWLFPLLAEERIKVVKGTELWRNRLRIMLSQTLPPSSSSSQQKLSPPSRTQQHRSSTNGNNNNNNNSDDDSESETEDEDDIDDDDDDDSDDDDDDESILEGVKTRLELKQQFQKLVKEFQYRANEYDQIYEGMLWLELAIWKGSFCGLQSLTKEERKKRWLTCGSTTIVKLVSQYF